MDPRFWKRPLWRNRYPDLWCFMCPLCKGPRRLPFRPHPGMRQFFQISLAALFFTIVCWPWFKWKGIVSFLPFWTVFETVYRMRMRAALYCSQCGFDPYLFMVDDQLAKKEVDTYWRKKFAEKGIPYPEKGKPSLPKEKASPEKSP